MASIHVLTPSAFKQPQQIFLEEPHFMAPLDHALCNFQVDRSPWTCARDWIDADVNHVTSTIQVFITSTQSAQIEDADFDGDMIYQVRLIVMIFKSVVSSAIVASNCLHLCTPHVLHT
jgi:hypothetical protein